MSTIEAGAGGIAPNLGRQLRANWPVLAVALGAVAVLLGLAGEYGLHRDELYFIIAGRHPDFGYVDQPPLTPLLNAISAAIFGVSTAGTRIILVGLLRLSIAMGR